MENFRILHITGYRSIAVIHEAAATVVLRAVREADGLRVVIKVNKWRVPAPADLTRYRRERDILSRIESDNVIACLGIAEQANRCALILEDFGGESLDKVIASRPLTTFEFLEIALQIVRALDDVHRAGVVHGDINPSHLVRNSDSGRLKIIGFSSATAPWLPLPLQLNDREPRGTLAFMSPEQTGRINRVVDHRSDLYSLGATLFALLVRAPPFTSEDTLGLVHAHIARLPIPPHELDSTCPAALSGIVMKLLAKAPEERYQSARGIQADLKYCLDQLQAGRRISVAFEPGRYDVPETFRISGKLYGRARERDIVAEALSRAVRGREELVLISGPSGVGKSALAFELGDGVTRIGGNFVAGKFDQIKRNAPYSAIAAAFQQLVGHLLNAGPAVLDRYRTRLREALSNNAQVIVDVVPQMELIIGAQEPVPRLPPDATRNRFHRVFKQFIGAIASIDQPLVLFLDDLQWADRASVNLVAELVSDASIEHVLMVGVYRCDEIGATHPLVQALARMKKEGAIVVELMLAPLQREDVADLLVDSFLSPRTDVFALANAVMARTEGNPFLVHRLLTQLHQSEFLRFDASQNRWLWDVEVIRTIGTECAAIDLVEATLRELPAQTQDLLSKAACLGTQFNLAELSIVSGADRSHALFALEPAIKLNLLSTVAERRPPNEFGEHAIDAMGRFGFVHDRVQQAAYELIPASSRAIVHLNIGRRLRGDRNFDELGVSGYEVLNHFNRGCALIDDPAERFDLSQLNFEAGCRAKASTAYSAAREYFDAARRLLTADAWQAHHEFARRVHCERAEAEYLVGDVQRARQLIEVALEHTESPVERAGLHDLLIVQFTLQGEYGEAMHVGRESLAALGVELPVTGIADAVERELNRVRDLDPKGGFPRLTEDDHMRDPRIQAVMRLMMNLLPTTDFTNPDLNSWIAVKMVNLSQEFGYSPESAKGFVNLGNVLALKGDYQRGYAFGKLALSVVEHFGAAHLKPRVLYTLTTYLNHWVHPLSNSRCLGDEAFKTCLDFGELQYAGYVLAFHKTMNEIFLGEDLDTVRGNLEEYLRFTSKTKNSLASSVVLAAYNTVANLCGESSDPDSFDSDLVTEKGLVADCELHGNEMAVCLLRILQAYTLLLYREHDAALTKVEEAADRINYVSSTMPVAILAFVEAMILGGMHDNIEGLREAGRWERILSHRDAMASWAVLCPKNFEAPSLLIQAEVARLEQRPFEAMRLYDRAAESGTGAGFVPIDALANEKAGRFWLAAGKHDFAKGYFEKAYSRYAKWGARRKLNRLAEEFPELAGDQRDALSSRSGTSSYSLLQSLDVDAVIRTSQAIASELRLERLLRTLVTVLIETAGAQRAVLFFAEPDGLKVEAVGDLESDRTLVLQSIPVANAEGFPKAVVDFVARTKREVVLDDARVSEKYGVDPYVRRNALKSLLCIPIIQQQSLVGLVYIENRLAAGVFTEDRVGLVRVLAAVAAIAINNALLFRTLERKVEERTAKLKEATRAAEKAKLVAEAANKAKSDFLANMSHELRTPLNAVIGFSDVLGEELFGPLNEKQAEYIDDIGQSGQHLLDLINDILDISKIEAGRLELQCEEFDLRAAMTSAATLVRGRAIVEGVALDLNIAENIGSIFADARKIKQVVVNLLTNAVRHTPPGGKIMLEVSEAKGRIEVTVTDTGIGIAAVHLDRIFEPFYQVKTNGRPPRAGTGLGLALCKELVELHGGVLSVESESGKGSAFTMSLPARL